MKKICVFLTFLILIIWKPNYIFNCKAEAEISTYAKVKNECILFKTSTLNNEINNVFFIIPETYFVMIIDTVSDTCYKVQYGDYIGYVDSSKVIIATFSPIVKFLDGITCDIKESSGTQVWSSPSATSSIFTTISAGTKNIKYIASVYGDKPSGSETNIWYYVNYTPENNSTNVYEGYIYSENVTNLTNIAINTETNPEVIPNEDIKEFSLYISSPIKILLISIVSIPIIILFLILLNKLSKIIHKKTVNDENGENNYYNNYSKFDYFKENKIENNNFNNQNLKNEIQNLSKKPFVRKIKISKTNYPSFPSYDSEDDLL